MWATGGRWLGVSVPAGTAYQSPALQRWAGWRSFGESRSPPRRAKGRQMNMRRWQASQPMQISCPYITRMSHSHTWVLTHCVFSTQGRLDLIPDVTEMCKYLTGVARAKDIMLLAAGGTANHIHILIAQPPTMALSKVMQDIKGNSSRWLNQRGVKFAWQEGFGGFSVSQSQKQVVANYIARQEEHHRKWTFEQEYMTLLRKSGVRIDMPRVFG